MKKITFLHLSDLHIGSKAQMGLLSQTKEILFEDIDYMLEQINTFDIVFFTGDLVQSGTKEEYNQLESFLQELWNRIKTINQIPYLICVPGNHDLEWIKNQQDAKLKTLLKWNEEDIKNEYFWNGNNEYLQFVKERFNNYTEWYNSTSINKPSEIKFGYLPGDFYCSLCLDNAKVGIVGLNSAFLQLGNGNYQNKLGIYNKQMYNLFGNNYKNWINEQDISFLLTHHAPDWYEPYSQDEYKTEIYSSNSFIEHLCGHMHEPDNSTTSRNGFPSRRLCIAPSLFGLETYGEKQSRIHGYTAGYYQIEGNKIAKTIFPRISIKTTEGTRKLSQNENFNLDKKTHSLTEIIFQEKTIVTEETVLNEPDEFAEKADNIFTNKKITYNLPRTIYKTTPSHCAIRQQERNRISYSLTDKKCCWITTKYGLGETEFIGSILEQTHINPSNCFSIGCDGKSTVDELMDNFTKVFSINITKFCDSINALDNPLLVFNGIDETLSENTTGLNEFLKIIFDFCPNLKVIIVSEFPTINPFFEQIELFSLEIPAVKQYVDNSSDIHSSFTHLEYEKIHQLSSGIPIYIDKVIEQLTFLPLSDISDMEGLSTYDDNDVLPTTVKNEIKNLQLEKDTKGSRIFDLLSVLVLLYNGETFERIKRIINGKLFHPDDVSYLLKHKLAETISINSIFNNISTDSELIKIIKVPRVVRDYIFTLLTDEQKIDIYKCACDLYLGEKWRTEIKLIQPKEVELDLIVYQNVQTAICFILKKAIETNNEIEVNRMANVALSFINALSNKSAYKDVSTLSESILSILDDVHSKDIEKTKIFITKKFGQSLRMSSLHEKSIEILKKLCEISNDILSKSDKNHIRLSIAYAYESMGEKAEAIKYAQEIQLNEKNKESNIYLSAESVIVGLHEDKATKISKLKSIRKKANKYSYSILSANVTFDLCRLEPDETQLKLLDKIINESKNDIYNKVRAFAEKAAIVLSDKNIQDIEYNDLQGLNIAYSYSFYQRLLVILNKCHHIAWDYWSRQNNYEQLLNLFRYSSFIWRLYGEMEKEVEYINILQDDSHFIDWHKMNRNSLNSKYYEQRIFATYGKNE